MTAMSLLRRITTYLQDVVDTLREVLAADDPLLCECQDDLWCVDCSLLENDAPAARWPTGTPARCSPLDAA